MARGREGAFYSIGSATLEGRLTATRADLLDRLDALAAGLADGALSVTRVGNLDNLDALVSSRLAAIKSLVRGTIAVSASGGGATSATATIAAVTMAKSELRMLGFTYSSAETAGNPRIDLTNTTTITANCGLTATGLVTCTVSYELTEYN